jgi:hypothetical protein
MPRENRSEINFLDNMQTVDDIKKVFEDAGKQKPADAVTLELRNGAVKSTVTLQPQTPASTNK